MSDPHPEYDARIFAHNLDQATTPAGLKVRWKIRIATGAEAKRLDQIQQQAIINLLTWAGKHKQQPQEKARPAPEIQDSNSPEPFYSPAMNDRMS